MSRWVRSSNPGVKSGLAAALSPNSKLGLVSRSKGLCVSCATAVLVAAVSTKSRIWIRVFRSPCIALSFLIIVVLLHSFATHLFSPPPVFSRRGKCFDGILGSNAWEAWTTFEPRSKKHDVRPHSYSHLTFAQRTIHVGNLEKTRIFYHAKPFPLEIKTLGDLLMVRRKQAKLTHRQLADKTGISLHCFRRWEYDRCVPSQGEWDVPQIYGFADRACFDIYTARKGHGCPKNHRPAPASTPFGPQALPRRSRSPNGGHTVHF